MVNEVNRTIEEVNYRPFFAVQVIYKNPVVITSCTASAIANINIHKCYILYFAKANCCNGPNIPPNKVVIFNIHDFSHRIHIKIICCTKLYYQVDSCEEKPNYNQPKV